MCSIVFRGIEGSNPLAFLAALGAVRLLHLAWPDRNLRIRWIAEGGWHPEITGSPTEDGIELCKALYEEAPWAPLEVFDGLGNNLTVERSVFEHVLNRAAEGMTAADRRAADFASAFGCEVLENKEKNRIEYTDLCFITGSGHQDFLGTARGLARSVRPEHLEEALFGAWRYADKGLSMRWDPDDAKEYALRWRDPSVGGVSSVWGANRLAFEALPLFPTLPTASGVRTTAFRTQNRTHEFTWPIWSQPVSVDTIRSLVTLRELAEDKPDRLSLRLMGIVEVFRVQRVRIGQGANFKVSFRPASAA